MGQSLLHTWSLQHGNNPTQKLQGQQLYMAAQHQALLNKDNEEDPAFVPVPSLWSHSGAPGFTLVGGELILPSPQNTSRLPWGVLADTEHGRALRTGGSPLGSRVSFIFWNKDACFHQEVVGSIPQPRDTGPSSKLGSFS